MRTFKSLLQSDKVFVAPLRELAHLPYLAWFACQSALPFLPSPSSSQIHPFHSAILRRASQPGRDRRICNRPELPFPLSSRWLTIAGKNIVRTGTLSTMEATSPFAIQCYVKAIMLGISSGNYLSLSHEPVFGLSAPLSTLSKTA